MFVGRKKELELLRQKNWRPHAQLIAVYGRRRIGKTALVEEAYRGRKLCKFDGLEGVSKQHQLDHFSTQLSQYHKKLSKHPPKLSDWNEAFGLLATYLDANRDEPLVVFFDEFQWMARMRTFLVSLFKSYWDNNFSRHRNLVVVLCGSISSFMVRKVIRSRALYGRVSTEIALGPLSLQEVSDFFSGRRTRQEIIDIAMCLGGIPQYLEELNPDFSLVQNLNEYAMSPGGWFFGEYNRIFISHFGRNRNYEKILDELSSGSRTTEQLAALCGTTTGGSFTGILEDLVLAGFIERYRPLNKGPRSRLVRYRLLDDYLHFYFSFVREHLDEIVSGGMAPVYSLPQVRYAQWQGYAFERLCRRNAWYISDFLRFSGIRFKAGSLFEAASQTERGGQIDLLFDRADKILTVCELKYTERLQSRALMDSFEKKIALLRRHYPRHSYQKVMISGKKIDIPGAVERYFDALLFAEDLFFSH